MWEIKEFCNIKSFWHECQIAMWIMFITLWRQEMFVTLECWAMFNIHQLFVHHIVMTWKYLSHSHTHICLSHCEVTMFGSLQHYYVQIIAAFGNVCHIATFGNVRHVMTFGNVCKDTCATFQCENTFITLRWQGYVHHILTSIKIR